MANISKKGKRKLDDGWYLTTMQAFVFPKVYSHQTFALFYLIPRHHNHFPTNHPTPYLNIPPQHPTIHGTFRTRGQSSATGATKGCYAIAPHLGSYRLNFAVRHVQDICSPQGAAGGRGVTSIVAAAFAAHGICVWRCRLGIEIQFWAWRDVPKEGAWARFTSPFSIAVCHCVPISPSKHYTTTEDIATVVAMTSPCCACQMMLIRPAAVSLMLKSPGHCKVPICQATAFNTFSQWGHVQRFAASSAIRGSKWSKCYAAESAFEVAKSVWIKSRGLHSILRLFWNCHVAFFRACLWAPCIYEQWLIIFTKNCIK